MDSNIQEENKNLDFYNEAINIALTGFEMRHPREFWPEWFSKCITVTGTQNCNKNWLISITVIPKMQLEPNQHWEEVNGKRVLVSTNQISGEGRIVICRASKNVEVLFEVEVDFVNASATVIVDTDINLLDGINYEICI